MAEPIEGWLENEFRNGLVWRSLLVQADSFERNPHNVLSAPTTEERARWLKRRNPAWAERYGGQWERVIALIAASQSAEAHRKATEAAQAQQRARDEAMARWREEQGQRRVLTAVGVAAGAIVLAGVAGWQWWNGVKAREAEHESVLDARAAQQRADDERTKALDGLALVRAQLEDALKADHSASAGVELQAIQTSVKNLRIELGGSSGAGQGTAATADDPAPRVYLHIGNAGQRDAAVAFGLQLAQRKLGAQRIVAPGTQLVAGQRNDGVLRCFRAVECRDEAQRLLDDANKLLNSPKLTLQDLSARYENSGLRPHHYEIWSGNANVIPTTRAEPAR